MKWGEAMRVHSSHPVTSDAIPQARLHSLKPLKEPQQLGTEYSKQESAGDVSHISHHSNNAASCLMRLPP